MDTNDLNLSADASCILQYLSNYPADFISEMEICRRAGGRGRFLEYARWAHVWLNDLLDLSLIESDGHGRYRIKSKQKKSEKTGVKYLAPAMREILEKSRHKIDLSGYE